MFQMKVYVYVFRVFFRLETVYFYVRYKFIKFGYMVFRLQKIKGKNYKLGGECGFVRDLLIIKKEIVKW